jgi:DNA-binding transcriptional LysR family regulator
MRDVEFSLGEMAAGDLWEALSNGRTDVGLMRPPLRQDGFESVRIHSEALFAAVPEHSPLADKESLSLEEIAREPFIMYDQNEARYFHDLTVSTFSQAGVEPTYIQHLSHVHSMLALVRGGLGCALVPASAIDLCSKGVVLRPLDLLRQPRVELFMVWRQGENNQMIDRLLQRVPRGPALVAA